MRKISWFHMAGLLFLGVLTNFLIFLVNAVAFVTLIKEIFVIVFCFVT